MNGIGRLLDYPVMLKLGLALMHFLWQGAVAGAVAALTLVALRKASAATRYVALLAVLAVMAATPVATYLVVSAAPRPVEARPLPASAPVPIASRTTVAVPADAAAAGAEFNVRAARPRLHGQSVLASLRNLLPWVVVLWAAGVVLLSLRLMTRWRVIGLAKSMSAELVGDRWRRTMETLAERLRVTRAVRLLESAAVQVPSVVGWLRPVILLPATALTGLTPEQWQAILAHELAHVRRGDYLINSAQTVVETLLFYHPAVWWVSGRIRLEREHCCDDLAAAACGDAAVYMRALAEMEQLRGVPEPALGVGGGSLLRRVRHLAGADDGRRGHLPQRLAGVVALTLIVASGMGVCLGSLGSNARPGIAPVPSVTSGHLLITLQLSPAKLSHPRPGTAPRTQGRPAISDSQIAQTKRVLAARITGYGLSEPTIQTERTSGDSPLAHVIVDISGERHDDETYAALKSLLTTPGDLQFLAVPRTYGCLTETRAAGRVVYTFTGPGGKEVPTSTVIAQSQRLVTSRDFEPHAQVISRPGQPIAVSFRLKESVRPAFEEFTRGHVGTRLAIVLDGQVLSCPLIRNAIPGGEGVILSDFDEPGGRERAKQLAVMINSGSLPLEVRYHAVAGAAGSKASRSPVPALIAKLKDENPAVRARAIDDLRLIRDYGAKEPAFQLVLAAVKDEDSTVRAEAAEALPGFRDSVRVLNPLVGALRDPSANVRRQAALALCFVGRDEGGWTPDPRVLEPLTGALTDEDPGVREAAADSLDEAFGSYSEPGLLDPTVRSRAVDALIVCLRDDSSNVRVAAANALWPARDPKAVDPLISALKDRDASVRSGAAGALGGLHAQRAVQPLTSALKDTNAEVRARAIAALYDIYRTGGTRPREPIVAALKDSDPRVRTWAASILEWIGGKRAVGPLLIALRRQGPADQANAQAREAAACALGRIGDRRAVPALMRLLTDKDRNVRWGAGWALGLLGDPGSQAHLRAAMKGDDPRPREGAALALALMADDSGVEHLLTALKSADRADRVNAAADMFALARERPDMLRRRVTRLTPFLNDSDREVRSDIAVALRDMHDPRADEALATLVDSRDASLRGMALQALGRMKNGRAMDAASRALKDEDPSIRMEAADVLKDAGDRRAVDALVGALSDEHWGVRAHAAAALRKLTGRDFGQDPEKWRSAAQPTANLGARQKAGPFQVTLTTASSRPIGRRVDFWATISKDGRAITNATVKLSLEATGTAGSSAILRAEQDHYRGSVDLPGGGEWKATLDVSSPEGTGSAKYSFNAR